MKCEACGEEGKRFTMHPSRSRKEFMESLCRKCSTLRKYEDAKLAEVKAQFKLAHQSPCADYLPNSDEGIES